VKALSLAEGRQGVGLLLLLLVLALLVHGGVAGELQVAAGGAELVVPRRHSHGDAVIDGVGHLAGQKAAPDQPVEPVLLAGEVSLDLLRGQQDVAGPYGLVGVLSAGLCLKVPGLGGAVGVSVAALDKLPGG